MTELPEPRNGMVVRFSYNWSDPSAPIKERPVCIIFVREVPDTNHDPLDGPPPILKEVVYLPISSKPPRDGSKSIEIPPIVVSRLGFKYPRAWVIVSEANVQYWPNDLAHIPGGQNWSYGFVPPGFFARIRETFREELQQRRASTLNVHYLVPRR